MIALKILAVLDLIGALGLILGASISGNPFFFWIGIIILAKGLWSVFTSAIAGYFADWMGWTDTVSALILITAVQGLFIGILSWIWIIMVLKAVYTLLSWF